MYISDAAIATLAINVTKHCSNEECCGRYDATNCKKLDCKRYKFAYHSKMKQTIYRSKRKLKCVTK